MFYFGIEHEVAFLNQEGKFADFSRTTYADFDRIIEKLPTYPSDRTQLHIGDAGIRKKRWYIDGFERFSESEETIDCVPRGIEIRTTIHPDIYSTITELSESFHLLKEVAKEFGFSPVLISFNPYLTNYEPNPPLNDVERRYLQAYPDEQTAYIYMVTYGPDLNISVTDLPIEDAIDIGQKLTYYSPYIVPFSYSSPFYKGGLWEGLSVRTFVRTGKRPATLVFVENQEQIIKSVPSSTKIARLPAEVGRIEFKAFDSCGDFSIYAQLLALLKGLVLDQTLTGRAIVPDAALHQLSAREGFENEKIFAFANQVLEAAEVALKNDPDVSLLVPLKNSLQQRKTPAHDAIATFQKFGSIEQALQTTYLKPFKI
ncbi:glutamate--cysteine ligase [Scytonema sp. NUACC26]|uniref:glutamate--cysteine ligase n=1 Tax=Scytonema sp. NUACC26 TaxID=3140176 RepID=UPI0034DBF864